MPVSCRFIETVCITFLEECARFMLFRAYAHIHMLYLHSFTYTAMWLPRPFAHRNAVHAIDEFAIKMQLQ